MPKVATFMVVSAAVLTMFVLPARGQNDAAADDAPSGEGSPAPLVRPPGGFLLVGSDNSEPFSWLDWDGQAQGYDVEVINAVAKKVALPIEVRLLPPDQALAAVKEGQADGLISLTLAQSADEAAHKQWILCGPTAVMEWALLVHIDNLDVKELNDLKGTRVAVVKSDPAAELIANNRSISEVYTNGVSHGCSMVTLKLVKAFLANRKAVEYAARRRGANEIKFVGQTVYRVSDYGPAIPATGSKALAEKLSTGVRQLRDDGTLASLQAKWFDYEINPTHWYDLAWLKVTGWIVAGCAVLAIIATVWVRRTRKAVRDQTRKLTGELEVLRKQLHELRDQEQRPTDAALVNPGEQVVEDVFAPVDLKQLVDDMAEAVRKVLGPEIDLVTNLNDGLPQPQVLADRQKVKECLLGLCANARDAIAEAREGEHDHAARVAIHIRQAKPENLPPAKKDTDLHFVALSVRDTGRGIAQDTVQRIFEPGYTTKPNAPGHGLAFVYATIAEHGGWIDVESAPGRGATFSIFLPAAE